MGAQRVSLSMIVRDEEAVLPRCLKSVRPLIDAWAIVDTGSTDDTIGVIERELAGIPGQVVSIPHPKRTWLDRFLNRGHFDFSKYRNAALDLSRKTDCDYSLLIDADEVVNVLPGFPVEWPDLVADRYCATFRVAEDGRVWHRTLLVKNSHPWRYIYPIHEALDSPDKNATAALIKGIEIPSYSDGARNKDKRQKYLNDAAALRAAIGRNPREPRYWFYLGQSLASADCHMQALGAYEKRWSMEAGWDEERWYALYQIAPLKEYLCYPWRQVRDAYLTAFNARPWRAEPLWAAGIISAEHGDLGVAEAYLKHAASLPIPEESFLLDEGIYRWRVADELAGVYARTGRAEECEAVLRGLVDSGNCPEAELPRILENIEKAVEHRVPLAA
jgi:glycosyltransferase involved in cell wall biosynthesis